MRITELLRNKGSDVVTIGPDATVRELIALLKKYNLGALVVSVDGQEIAGIVSERDVVRRLADAEDLLDVRVGQIMTAPVFTCSLHDTVRALMPVMTGRRIRHLPVVGDDGRLTGIVSIGDLVKSHIDEVEFERDQLQGYVSS